MIFKTPHIRTIFAANHTSSCGICGSFGFIRTTFSEKLQDRLF
jgi:hypothetical protein